MEEESGPRALRRKPQKLPGLSARMKKKRTNTDSTDVPYIFEEITAKCVDMANTDNANEKETKEHTIDTKSESHSKAVAERVGTKEKLSEEPKKNKRRPCLKIFYIMLGVFTVMVAVAMIIETILTSIATRAYDADQSSRIAAMVLLAMTAAIAICMVIYMEVATFKCSSKSMYGSATVILIMAIVQGLISGIAVDVQPADEAKLLKSLADSFKQAKEAVPRHYKMWSMTQYELNCCGIFGPEDYRTEYQPYYFSPDVPISCCPAYNPDRSDLVQERERETCKSKKSYYNIGCKDLVLFVLNDSAKIVLTVTTILIISEVILLIVGVILYKEQKKRLQHNKVSQSPT